MTYQLQALTYLDQIAAVRLRVLPDPSLPKKGPGTAGNGNFVLTSFQVSANGKPAKITKAFADHEQHGYPVAATLDNDRNTGWAINGQLYQEPRKALFQFAQPVQTKEGESLVSVERIQEPEVVDMDAEGEETTGD